MMRQNLLSLMLILVVASVGAWLKPGRSAPQELQGCRSNLKNLVTALEMYSSDHGGRYPLGLGQLVPGYLRRLPTCPTTGMDYHETYRCVTNPDCFSFGCQGRAHGEPLDRASDHHFYSTRGYPWYDAENGCMCHD